jgi:hypothetical protein
LYEKQRDGNSFGFPLPVGVMPMKKWELTCTGNNYTMTCQEHLAKAQTFVTTLKRLIK